MLHTKDCIHYYCNQAGGGDYFKGVPHQRGFGLFGDIFRKISPFLLNAAKYVGKQLFHTGSKVVEDVAMGKSLKESAARRMKETGNRVKDDVIHKLQSGSGIKRRCIGKSGKSSKAKGKIRQKRKQQKDIFTR